MDLINDLINSLVSFKETELKLLMNHFNIKMEDIPERVFVEYDDEGGIETYFVDGKIALIERRILDLDGLKSIFRFERIYLKSEEPHV